MTSFTVNSDNIRDGDDATGAKMGKDRNRHRREEQPRAAGPSR
jgi:hypothetical protein